MRDQLALDGRGRNILPLAGLELLLDAADNLELAIGGDFANVSGVKKTIRQ